MFKGVRTSSIPDESFFSFFQEMIEAPLGIFPSVQKITVSTKKLGIKDIQSSFYYYYLSPTRSVCEDTVVDVLVS